MSFSQFDDKEIYGYFRNNIGVSLTSEFYTTTLNNTSLDYPLSTSLNLGGGYTPEIGLGFMLVENVFIESYISQTFNSRKVNKNPENTQAINSYSFNQTGLGVNGVYIVDIDGYFNIDVGAGVSLKIPHDLVINTSTDVETIQYKSTIGYRFGFGGNYWWDKLMVGASMSYRFENYSYREDQDLPDDFLEYNSDLQHIKVAAVDISFTVKYLF